MPVRCQRPNARADRFQSDALYAFGVLLSLVVDTVVIATLGAIALFAIVGGALYLAYYEVIGSFAELSYAGKSCVVAGGGVLGVAVIVGTLLVARRLFCGRAPGHHALEEN